jgi:hypothetical protein
MWRFNIKLNAMRKALKNKRNMYGQVLDTCLNYQNAWGSVPAFEGIVERLQTKIALFDTTNKERLQIDTSETVVKNNNLKALTDEVYTLVKIIRAIGLANDDKTLAAQYDVRKTVFRVGGARTITNRFNLVLDKAEELIVELEPYGIDTAHVIELKLRTDQLMEEINTPRKRILRKKILTRNLDLIAVEIDQIIRQELDGLVELIGQESPEFFNAFQSARSIVDLKSRRENNASGDNPVPFDTD